MATCEFQCPYPGDPAIGKQCPNKDGALVAEEAIRVCAQKVSSFINRGRPPMSKVTGSAVEWGFNSPGSQYRTVRLGVVANEADE